MFGLKGMIPTEGYIIPISIVGSVEECPKEISF